MKRLLTFFALFITFAVRAQTYVPIHNYQKPDAIWATRALTHPTDTSVNKLVGSTAYLNGVLYVKNAIKWEALASSGVISDSFALLTDIPALIAYSGNKQFAVVQDSVSGSLFDYYATGLTVDNGEVMAATGKGGGYWKRNNRGFVNVKDFGAVGDGVHDDRPAILAAIRTTPRDLDAPGTTQPTPGRLIYFPRGRYYCSDSIRVTRVCHFLGEGGYLGSASSIVFAQNKYGFVIERYNTDAYDTAGVAINFGGVSRAADGTIFENLSISQKDGSTNGIGIWARATFEMHNCSVTKWTGGIGVFIVANASDIADKDKIKNVFISDPGDTNYVTAPAVIVTPTHGGSGATMHAVLGGEVSHVTVSDQGAGYVEEPTMRVQENEDVLETTVLLHGYGCQPVPHMGVNTASITNPGSGYTTATATINSPTGSGATATLTISGGAITGITITAPGEDYALLSTTTITITGNGTGATAKVNDLLVARVGLRDKGVNYETTLIPHVYFIGGRRGTGHNAIASVDSLTNFMVKRVVIDTRGDGYFTPPNISFSGGGGSGAIAWCTRFGGESGNANRWKLKDVRIDNNAYGLYVSGGDVNAGYYIGGDLSGNRLYGLYENSFLGNTYTALHASTNGWGPYLSVGNTANNLFINCYSEGGQPPAVGVNPARFLQGTHGAGIRGTGITDNSPIKIDRASVDGKLSATLFGDLGNNEILNLVNGSMDAGGSMRWKVNNETTDLSMDWYNSVLKRNWIWTGTNTALTFGRSAPIPYAVYNQQLFTGTSTTNARQIASSAVFPPAKITGQTEWAKGDYVINTNPTISGTTPNTSITSGWMRLTSGTDNVLGTDWFTVTARESGSSYTDANARAAFSLTTTGTSGTATYNSTTGVFNIPAYAAGTGTVTSVGLSVSGVLFSVSGTPVTTSGTLALSLLTQSANTVLAGPSSGASATPTMRQLVSADLAKPTLTTLTDASTITWDYSVSSEVKVTLAGNRTLAITNLPSGVSYGTINVTQDATGSRTITLPSGSKVINGGSGTISLSSAAGAADILVFRWNGTNYFWTIGKNYN